MTTYVAIVGILALAIFGLWVLDSSYRRRERAFDRREVAWLEERRQLLNRVMYSQGKPWEGPPEEDFVEPPYVQPEIVDPLLEAM